MTKEYFERKSYLEQTKNQIEWNEKIFQIGKIIIEKTNNLASDPKINLLKKYRDASTIYGSKGSISEYFYNKYS